MRYSAIIFCAFFIFFSANAYAENSGIGPDANLNAQQEIEALEHAMIIDQKIVDLILSLQYDPDFIKVMTDPEILKAMDENDLEALMNNLDFMKLLENETVLQIQEELERLK